MTRKRPTPSLRDDLRARRDDASEWSDEAVPVVVKTPPTEVLSFRISSGLLDRLEQAAGIEGVSISEYIRTAIDAQMKAPAHVAEVSLTYSATPGAEHLFRPLAGPMDIGRQTYSSPTTYTEENRRAG